MKLTLNEYWEEYRTRVIPGCSDIAVIKQRQAFYSGVMALHALLCGTMPLLPPEAQDRIFLQICADIDEFAESLVPDNDRILGMLLGALMEAQGKKPDA